MLGGGEGGGRASPGAGKARVAAGSPPGRDDWASPFTGGHRNYSYTKVSLGFSCESFRVLLELQQETRVLGGPRGSWEVPGRSPPAVRRSTKEASGNRTKTNQIQIKSRSKSNPNPRKSYEILRESIRNPERILVEILEILGNPRDILGRNPREPRSLRSASESPWGSWGRLGGPRKS